jgi:hypothetical protein
VTDQQAITIVVLAAYGLIAMAVGLAGWLAWTWLAQVLADRRRARERRRRRLGLR